MNLYILMVRLITVAILVTACSEKQEVVTIGKRKTPSPIQQPSGLGSSNQTRVDDCQSYPDKVNETIKLYVDSIRGAEFCRFRTLARGDINSDGIEDVVVVFSVEGACLEDKTMTPGACGNHAEQYLTAFLGQQFMTVPMSEVGQDWGRLIKNITVNNGVIEAETMAHGPNDAHVDFSVTGKTKFVLKDGVLVEQMDK